MDGHHSDADFYFERQGKWQRELRQLRSIVLECGLLETLKWGVPCYTLHVSGNNKASNIVLIHTFRDYCALLFFKGALLNNKKGLLIQQTKNVQAARQIRFTAKTPIGMLEADVKAIIHEAIAIEKAGMRVKLKNTKAYGMPDEFQQKLNESKTLKDAFAALTPGRQRAYLLYFAAPKLEKTRIARVEKSISGIRDGKGLND